MYLDLKKRILITITQHNLWKTTERCIKSIREHTDLSDVNLLIIDDYSDEPTAKEWINNVPEVVLGTDKVFHHNSITRQVLDAVKDLPQIEYVCALNNDIIVTDNWLKNIVTCMDNNKEIAVMGAKDNNEYHKFQNFPIPEEVKPITSGGFNDFGYLIGDDSKLQEYINKEFYAKRKSNVCVVTETIDGTVMFIRKSAAIAVGGLNKEYDDYAGDSEFYIRLQKAGFHIGYCLSSFVYHLGGGAGGKYESFRKSNGRELADACSEKTERLSREYGIDITTYGRSLEDKSWIQREAELVKLE